MLKVNVTYLTPFREITGRGNESVLLKDGAILRDLVTRLSEVYGSKFQKHVSGENPFIVLMINGKGVHEHGLETRLENVDSIVMGILLGGG